MKYSELIGFRKELYFEGAVQIDWFYNQSKSAKVAENFVFHGKDYFGVDSSVLGGKKRIDTISLVQALSSKLNDDSIKIPSLAIADYGTGKSHLAVTIAQLFSGPDYMPETFNKIINNIETIDKEAANSIRSYCDSRNFVIVLNGMRDFNLHSEILKATQKSLNIYGLSDEKLKKINRAYETAEMFFERNIKSSIEIFENSAEKIGWSEKGSNLVKRLKAELLSNEEAFNIINLAYLEVNGQEIRWDEGLSASSILDFLVNEYCGMNGKFDHIIILFDEFGRYLEYASGVNTAKSGDSALQQIFEAIQNYDGVLQVINFIQSDIKTYLQRVDQTKNISRYIGRYDGSDKYYISSNLETVFANLIERKDKEAFKANIISWQKENEENWKESFDLIGKWLNPKGMWREYKLFRRVIVEGIYPMHPFSTFMLSQLSDYLQNRSSLTLISQYIENLLDRKVDRKPILIMPEYLMTGDLYTEMLAAEQEGKQQSQHCIRYANVISKFGDKLSENSLKVLRSNLILRILRFRTVSYEDVKNALSFVSGLEIDDIEEELNFLENEYAVLGFDDHANCFDFMEESNGAHEFKILKKRLIASVKINNSYINTIKIQNIAGVTEMHSTNFGITHKITTNEWFFKQELIPIEEFTEQLAEKYVNDWELATTSVTSKGRLVWLYLNKNTDNKYIEKSKKIINKFESKPIVVMLLNDDDNRLFDSLIEYYVYDNLDDKNRKKYDRFFNDGFNQAEFNLKDEFDQLKKKHLRLTEEGVVQLEGRMSPFLTNVFEDIYPNAISFSFDGFITKSNNLGGKGGSHFCSIIKMLLSNSVNADSIHNFPSDVRNRIDALLMKTNNNSWKCINEEYHLIPPEEKKARFVYDEITTNLTNLGELNCKDIFLKYCFPPYGLSEDVVTLMIAVICANMSYCLRFKYNKEVTNVNNWKELVIIKDKKIDIDVIKKSILVIVDAGEVIGKYKRLFTQIKDNRLLTNVDKLFNQLENMEKTDEIPEEIENEHISVKYILDRGLKAKKEWDMALENIKDKINKAADENNFYLAVDSLDELESISIEKYFDDNGFDFDDDSEKEMKELKGDITKFIDGNINDFVSNMYCKNVEGIISFRNHHNKIIKKLEDVGLKEYARKIDIKKENELNNISEIKSRQELRVDIDRFLNNTVISKFTSLVSIKEWVDEGLSLQIRIKKYNDYLGKDGIYIVNKFYSRISELINTKDKIEDEIGDLWDNLSVIKNVEDIKNCIDEITNILHKGIADTDQIELSEIKNVLTDLLTEVEKLKSPNLSRNAFKTESGKLKEKYNNLELDFEIDEVLESIINNISNELDEKEKQWKTRNLSLGDKSRKTVLSWLEKVSNPPEFLSTDTKKAIDKLKLEANEIIKDGKIEDVMYYFEKLNKSEREECLQKLKKLI